MSRDLDLAQSIDTAHAATDGNPSIPPVKLVKLLQERAEHIEAFLKGEPLLQIFEGECI